MKRTGRAGDYLEVESAGLVPGTAFYFDPGIVRCGTITDGVAFNIGGGAWVIPYAELCEMVKEASFQRERITAEQLREVHGSDQ